MLGFGVMGAAIDGAALLKAAVSGVIGVVNSISVQLKTQGAVSFTSIAVAFGSYFLGSGLSGELFEMFIDDVLQEGMGVLSDMFINLSAFTNDVVVSNPIKKDQPTSNLGKTEEKYNPYGPDYEYLYSIDDTSVRGSNMRWA